MKFPSFSAVVTGFVFNIRRFPVAAICSFVAVILTINMNHAEFSDEIMQQLMPFVLTACFVFPLALASDLFAEERKFKFAQIVASRVVLFLIAALAYWYFFRNFLAWGQVEWLRFILTEGMAICLFLVVPFLYKAKDANKSFWVYTLDVVGSFAKAFSLFALLFIGIALLLSSFDYLFDVYLDEKIYADVWLIITGILGVPFFMSGIPLKLPSLAKKSLQTNHLVLLTKYFLAPLVFLYVLLLYAYTGRILLLWEWPVEGVAGWIIGFSTVGIVTYFSVAFLEEKFQSYLQSFRKIYFWALIPLIGVLFAAVWVRIAEYGVTELRYFGIAFALWMALISLYYIFSKAKDLRFLPLSLALILFVSAWAGPFSAFGASLNSQMTQLENLLVKNDLLIDGQIIKIDEEKIEHDDLYRIDNLFNYIISTHGVMPIDPWFEEDLQQIADENEYYWDTVQDVKAIIGLAGVYDQMGYDMGNLYVSFVSSPDACVDCIVDVSGYEKAFFINDVYFELDGWYLDWQWDDATFDLQYKDETVLKLLLKEELEPYYLTSNKVSDIYVDMIYPFETDEFEGEIRFIKVDGQAAGERLDEISWFRAVILYNEK